MDQLDPAPLKKARAINLDPNFYGAFAEIGAGQEVARYFFLAGRASQTIAKTMSAYDMTVSDSIYGKSGRYVSEDRLLRMLDHEISLLIERLDEKRGATTRFFSFADTVATSSHAEPTAKCHGWMGVRFQTRPKGPVNDIVLHVRMKDRARLQQQEALGVLGVNVIDLAHNISTHASHIVERLMQNLDRERVEINLIRLTGPDLKDIDNRLVNLEMVKFGVTEAVLFEPTGAIANPSDTLFRRPILVQRGTFRPVTNTNVALLERGFDQFQRSLPKDLVPAVMFELTMNSLSDEGQLSETDFLDRVDTLCALGHSVLLSNFNLFYQLKQFLRSYTDQPLALIVGAAHLEKLFAADYYKGLPGGILEGFSRLFDEHTRVLVFPFKVEKTCMTAATYHPPGALTHLYRYLVENGQIVDITNCEDVNTSVHSRDVRGLLARGERGWENMVPLPVRDLIIRRRMFGAKG